MNAGKHWPQMPCHVILRRMTNRWWHMRWFLMFVLVTAVSASAQTAPQARHGDGTAFCRVQGDVDFPGALPPAIARLDETLRWRCMAGKVLVCSDSADGDWCAKKDASREPSRLLREACREDPNKDALNFAQGHYSAFDWRCRSGVPVIVKSYALDGRGFFKAPWVPLIVQRGVVVGPTDLPPGPR
ncbi:MAG: hypothetical protein JWP16_2656 [Alphaproteobacteria bacterium]|jgi:hypothetical protein|nr:hypothetical protein [Alphaproteobacteria bacterium]MDB5741616.1 hypothetical protein [Alphaproteobacteria bacterium]